MLLQQALKHVGGGERVRRVAGAEVHAEQPRVDRLVAREADDGVAGVDEVAPEHGLLRGLLDLLDGEAGAFGAEPAPQLEEPARGEQRRGDLRARLFVDDVGVLLGDGLRLKPCRSTRFAVALQGCVHCFVRWHERNACAARSSIANVFFVSTSSPASSSFLTSSTVGFVMAVVSDMDFSFGMQGEQAGDRPVSKTLPSVAVRDSASWAGRTCGAGVTAVCTLRGLSVGASPSAAGGICGSWGPRLRGRLEAAPEGMAACGRSLEGSAQMQCWLRSNSGKAGSKTINLLFEKICEREANCELIDYF